MKGMGTIALREIVEKRMLLLLALAFGLLSVLLPILPFFRESGSAQESRDLIAWVFASGFSATLAAMLGASVVGRDLSEGRMGFYFARPVSGLALWAGKFSGAYLLVLCAGFLTLLPATLFGGGLLTPIFEIGRNFTVGLEDYLEGVSIYLLLAAALLFLIVLAHAFSVAIRSRSAWIFVDLVALCTLAVTALFIGRTLTLRGAFVEAMRLCEWLAGGILVALIAASAVQVCAGRTDIRRGHRALSIALWFCIALCLLGVGLHAAWYLDVPPSKLKGLRLNVPCQGNWVVVTGSAREKDNFYASFVVDTRTGKTLDIGSAAWSETDFAPDGSLVCWLSPTGWPWKPSWELVTMDLSVEKPHPRHTSIVFDDSFMAAIFSSTGERLAYAAGESMSVVETGTLKSLGSFHLPVPKEGRWWVSGHFMTDDRLRVYLMQDSSKPPAAGSVTILEFDVSTRRLSATGSIQDTPVPRIRLDAQRDHLLVSGVAGEDWKTSLHDGRTGSLLAPIPSSKSMHSVRITFLSDGRIALALEEGSKVELHLFSPEGQPMKTLDLGEGTRPALGGETAPGCLALTIKPTEKRSSGSSSPTEEAGTILFVDLANGQIRRVVKDHRVTSAALLSSWWRSDATCTLVPGSPSSRLFVGQNTLWELDPANGTERVILKAGQ